MLTAPQQLYITRQALQAMEEEALRYADTQGVGHETGGILIGRRLPDRPDTILILIATGPGEHAVRTPVEFSPDVQYVNQQMIAARAIYPRIDYIGTWHKHPREYRTFSPGDVQTAHAIFKDSSYVTDELVSPIVWIDNGRMTIHYYYMSRRMAEQGLDFDQLANRIVELIPDDHPLVQHERASSSGGSGHLPPAWVDEECGGLQVRGYAVQVRHERGRQAYLFIVTNPLLLGVTITFVASEQDYPRERPQIFIEGTGRDEPVDSDKAYADLERRLSQVYLVDVADAMVNHLRRRRQGAGRTTQLKPISVMAGPDLTSKLILAPGTAEKAAPPALEGPRPTMAWPAWLLIVPGLLAVLALIWFLRPSAPPPPTTDYAALWTQIKSALDQPSDTSVRAAITQLERIRSDDPGGVILARNRDVTSTLVLAYTILGGQLITTSPSDLDGADQAFISALSLSPQNPTAQAGHQQVRVSLKATAAASAQQQEIARRWQNVDAAPDAQTRVTLIQALLADGITADTNGTPTTERLQTAVDNQAIQLLAAAQQGDRATALNTLQAVTQLEPAPSDAILADASDRLRQIEAQIREEQQFFTETWAVYDQTIKDKDVLGAISALEAIIQRAGEPLPDPSYYPADSYDPRIAQAGLLLVDAQLSYAGNLQRAADMAGARAQYDTTEPTLHIMEQSRRLESAVATRRSTYQNQFAEFTQGENYWSQFNDLVGARKLSAALRELDGLLKLSTFGPNARNPQNPQQSVSALIAQINWQLHPPATPTARPTEEPTPLPTEEPTPAPSVEPATPEQTSPAPYPNPAP